MPHSGYFWPLLSCNWPFFDNFGIPFWVTVLVTISLIWLYTFRGGIKTIVWTDTLQTSFLLLAVLISILVILDHLSLDMVSGVKMIQQSDLSRVFDWNWKSDRNFFKTFLAGIFITIAMNGLDQNVMQKNLTCRNQKEAQKNIFWFSVSFFLFHAPVSGAWGDVVPVRIRSANRITRKKR